MKTERKQASNHLADEHGIWLTTRDYRRMSLDEIEALDPCKKRADHNEAVDRILGSFTEGPA